MKKRAMIVAGIFILAVALGLVARIGQLTTRDYAVAVPSILLVVGLGVTVAGLKKRSAG